MKEARLAGLVLVLAVSLLSVSSVWAEKDKDPKKEDKQEQKEQNGNGDAKIPLCHATGSETNPFEFLELPEEGAEGHEGHPNDIIPITDRNEDGKIDEADCTFVPNGNGNGNGNGQGGGPVQPIIQPVITTERVVQVPVTQRVPVASGVGGGPVEGFGGGATTLPETGPDSLGVIALFGLPAIGTLLRKIKK